MVKQLQQRQMAADDRKVMLMTYDDSTSAGLRPHGPGTKQKIGPFKS